MTMTPGFLTDDGLDLHQHDWPAPQPSARLLLVHGLGEHAGRYALLAGALNRIGISVRAYDHRGHGHSAGKRGAIGPTADCLSRDIVDLFQAYAGEADDVPFLLGHSMGGLVVMHAVLAHGLRPRGLIASAPALASHAGRFQRLLATVLSRLAPNLAVGNGLPADKLSHAPQVAAQYLGDPLNHDRISARLARYLFTAGPQVIAAAPSLSVPTLLQIAAADHLVDPAGARAFAAAAPARLLHVHDYPGLYHELYNEAEPARSQVVGDLCDWLGRNLQGGAGEGQ